MPDFELPPDPERHMGGHGLYSTVGDYMKFIRMILNGGEGEHGRVLTPEMVEMMGPERPRGHEDKVAAWCPRAPEQRCGVLPRNAQVVDTPS